MYQIYLQNGNIAMPLHGFNEKEKIQTAKINEEINAIESFSFMIYPSHQCYNSLQGFTTLVKVWNTKRSRYDFIGRVLTVNPQMDSNGMVSKSIVCEGRLAYLCDSTQMYVPQTLYEGDANRTAVQQFLDVLLDQHNTQMPDEKKIYRGNVTFAADEKINCAIGYEKTFDAIKKCLLDKFGGEIRLREADGVLYLDYAENFGATRTTTIELAKNMESARRDVDPTSIITRLIPLGAKKIVKELQVEEDGEEKIVEVETEERITIANANNGVVYIQDDMAFELYGAIYATQTWEDVTEPATLLKKASAWLANNNKMPVTNDVTAVDLSLIGLAIDDFVLGDRYPVKNSLIGLNSILRIVKKVIDINEPHKSSFTMGDEAMLLSDYIMGGNSQIVDIAGQLSSQQTNITNLPNNIMVSVDRQLSSLIKQSESEIMAEVAENTVSTTEYGEFTQIVRNVLRMDVDGTTMLFQTIDSNISEVNGKVESNYNELTKYIRFEDGNIILGETGNEITLTVSNNRLSFKQNGVEVAYLSNNNLYIGNAIIQDGGKLQIGNFAFIPRTDGSMSLLKVGG